MDYLYLILILAIAAVPAAVITTVTNRKEKRGCGRGCAKCGNREFCHRKKW